MKSSRASARKLLWRVVSIVAVAAALALLAVLSTTLVLNDSVPLGICLGAVVVLLAVIFSVRGLYPLRWVAPGLALLIVFFLYPAINTAVISQSNFGAQHLLSQEQAIERITSIPLENAKQAEFEWFAYQNGNGDLGILLINDESIAWASPDGDAEKPSGLPGPGGQPPATLGDYTLLTPAETLARLQALGDSTFVTSDDSVVAISSLSRATTAQLAYRYDKSSGEIVSNETGEVFRPVDGLYTSASGDTLSPGFTVSIGARNFVSVVTDPLVREPFFRVFGWNLVFAGVATLTAFALGFALALVVNRGGFMLRRVFRAGYLMPYILPIFITAPVWVGLLNPVYGPVNTLLQQFFGVQPDWFGDVALARIALLIIALWLGFPYAMLVCLGALQSVPRDLLEAVAVDGGTRSNAVRHITLPWVLSSIAPLMVGAFAFNFNSFAIIELVTKGGPPDLTGSSPAGYTDILLSYTYRLGFTGGEGINYGLAAAISILIFFVTAGLSLINFRLAARLQIHEV